jgi:membrane protein DedA with SNARE-associated domain
MIIYLGYILGDNLDKIICIMKNYWIIIVLILVLFTGIYYIRYLLYNKKAQKKLD